MLTSDLQARTLERLGDTASGEYVLTGYYTPSEVLNWLNAAQRLFVLLTMCLETTASLTVTANTAFYRLLPIFPDFLLPLRVRLSTGAKLKPSTLSDLASLDSSWSKSSGTPTRYAAAGFDLFAICQQPSGSGLTASLTYARCPDPLVNPSDVPEIPDEYHPTLMDLAIPLCRAKEGGGEWKKILPLWDRGLDAATRMGDYVRARNKERGYDRMPVELARFDRSKMLEVAGGK